MAKLAPEMRAIFALEVEEYLALMTEGFLALEKNPSEEGWPDRMFRAAHSLKGTSRVMGCHDLARAGHGLEDLLDRLRGGTLVLGPAQFDALSRTMDGFRQLVALTLDEGETAAPADELLAILKACSQLGAPSPVVAVPSEQGSLILEKAPPEKHSLEVLKVPVARLDELISQVGELLVTHQRIRGYAELCAQLGDQLEEGTRKLGLQVAERVGLGQAALQTQRLAQSLSEEEGRMERLFETLEAAVHHTRLVPLSTLFEQFPKWVRDASSAMGKTVDLQTEGAELELDKRLVEGLRDPLLHMIRNAVDHGIESPERRKALGKPERGLLRVLARKDRNGIVFQMEDDGAGLDPESIRQRAVAKGIVDPALAQSLDAEALNGLLFLPGFSTRDAVTEYSGRGVGLDVVATRVASLKGDVRLSGEPGKGCRVSLWVPQSLNSTRVLHVEDAGLSIGIPSTAVRACLKPEPGDCPTLEGRPALIFEGTPILLISLARLLGTGTVERTSFSQVVVVDISGERLAIGVDGLLGELEVLQKPLPPRLRGLEVYGGVSILGDGRLLLMVDALQLQSRARGLWRRQSSAVTMAPKETKAHTILLVDDSLTTRVQLRRILESAGYVVQPAVDGLDAWSRLTSQAFDAVVSDVQMPGLDGYALTARIRTTPTFEHLPVILVTTLASEADQQHGLEVGANAYITKGSFDQEQLLESLALLLREVSLP